MTRLHARRAAAGILLALSAAGCLLPDDRSAELQVDFAPVPTLFQKDSLQLTAALMDGRGEPVPNVVIRFSSSDLGVVNVDPGGRLLAVNAGSATVTATAIEFAGAAPVSRTVQVRGLLEVDSIRPAIGTFFGQLMDIYGVGLFPDSIFVVTVGGVQAKVFDYVAEDPAQPMRFGRLRIWTPPPAERRSQVFVLGFKGALVLPDSVDVFQRDVYEPNDTLPAMLGAIPFGIDNPALAFEVRGRKDTTEAADWYRFTNTVPTDRTILVASERVGAETFQVFVTDSLFWGGFTTGFGLGPGSWTIGPNSFVCGGLEMTLAGQPFNPPELPFPFTLLALGDLPAGTYDVFVPYKASGEPAPYQLAIVPGYFSVRPRDVAEENDYCDVAPDLSIAAGRTLSIDNFHDRDWFTFTRAGPSILNLTVTATDADADLDFYLIRDFRPDSLPIVDRSTDVGDPTKAIVLPAAGRYFLLIVDFAGVPTAYTITASFTAPPALPVAPAPASTDDASLQAKTEAAAAGVRRPLRPVPRGAVP